MTYNSAFRHRWPASKGRVLRAAIPLSLLTRNPAHPRPRPPRQRRPLNPVSRRSAPQPLAPTNSTPPFPIRAARSLINPRLRPPARPLSPPIIPFRIFKKPLRFPPHPAHRNPSRLRPSPTSKSPPRSRLRSKSNRGTLSQLQSQIPFPVVRSSPILFPDLRQLSPAPRPPNPISQLRPQGTPSDPPQRRELPISISGDPPPEDFRFHKRLILFLIPRPPRPLPIPSVVLRLVLWSWIWHLVPPPSPLLWRILWALLRPSPPEAFLPPKSPPIRWPILCSPSATFPPRQNRSPLRRPNRIPAWHPFPISTALPSRTSPRLPRLRNPTPLLGAEILPPPSPALLPLRKRRIFRQD